MVCLGPPWVIARSRWRLRGKAEANPEIPRFARNKLRNLKQNNEIATPFSEESRKGAGSQ